MKFIVAANVRAEPSRVASRFEGDGEEPVLVVLVPRARSSNERLRDVESAEEKERERRESAGGRGSYYKSN